LSISPAWAHGTVDQKFEDSGGDISLFFAARGQSFVPTVDNLVAVELSLFPSGSDSAQVRVSIHEGNPDGSELGAVTQTVSSGWNHFDFDPPIVLTPGATYSIRASAVSGNTLWAWRQVNLGGPNYPNGSAYSCSPTCTEAPFDFLFRTYYVADNQAPVANTQSLSTDEDTSVAISLSGSDADDNDLTFSIVSGPSHGTLGTISTADCSAVNTCSANVSYTPTPNYSGADSFTFKVNDGTADSNVAIVNITVNALSATQEVARLENQVKALINAGVLNGTQGNGLLSKLSAAKAALSKNKTATVCSNLQEFINKVVDLRASGKLTTAQAQPLLDGANNLRQELGC
jgi:hypothetical protein